MLAKSGKFAQCCQQLVIASLVLAGSVPAAANSNNPFLRELNKTHHVSVPHDQRGGHACNSESPRLQSLGEAYYEMEMPYNSASRVSGNRDSIKESLNKFYQKLEGRWYGAMVDNYCQKDNGQSTPKMKLYALDKVLAEFDHRDQLILKRSKERVQFRNGQLKTISKEVETRERFITAAELQKVRFISDNSVSMNWRQRLRAQPSASVVFRERQDTLTLENNRLKIQSDWFINGTYSGTETTLLQRRR